jgi:uncharacterized protein (TIGR00299 family) protein
VLAILDPFSGVAGDMFIGALIDAGLEAEFIEGLPSAMGLENIGVRIARTQRCGISAIKVDFDIPPQPHGRHLRQLVEIVDRSAAPGAVKARAVEAFKLIASVEADIHGTTVDKVHLHEVGAVDAILDVVGTLWGAAKLGITDVCCGTVRVGDGFVDSAHGRMPVPAPATMRILEGLTVAPGPAGSGELTTPTGAALVRVLSTGGIPDSYVPRRTGYGAGTKEFSTRPNVFRVILAEAAGGEQSERVTVFTADIDDMSPERLALAAETMRTAGALDVTMTAVIMKKGRPGVRLEVITNPIDAGAIESAILMETSSIGVRRNEIFRRVLPRGVRDVVVEGQRVSVKVVTLPDGSKRAKPESDDVRDAALATGLPIEHISHAAKEAAQRFAEGV